MHSNLNRGHITATVAFLFLGSAAFAVLALVLLTTSSERNPLLWTASGLFGLLVGNHSAMHSRRASAVKPSAANDSQETAISELPQRKRWFDHLHLLGWALLIAIVLLFFA